MTDPTLTPIDPTLPLVDDDGHGDTSLSFTLLIPGVTPDSLTDGLARANHLAAHAGRYADRIGMTNRHLSVSVVPTTTGTDDDEDEDSHRHDSGEERTPATLIAVTITGDLGPDDEEPTTAEPEPKGHTTPNYTDADLDQILTSLPDDVAPIRHAYLGENDGLAVTINLDGRRTATRPMPDSWPLLTVAQRCALVDEMKRDLLASAVAFSIEGPGNYDLEGDGACGYELPGVHTEFVSLIPDRQLPSTAHEALSPDVLAMMLDENQALGATITAWNADSPETVKGVVMLRFTVEFSGKYEEEVRAAAETWKTGAGAGYRVVTSAWEPYGPITAPGGTLVFNLASGQ